MLVTNPARRGQLVGVAGDTGRRQLVDVGEDEFGEPGDGGRRYVAANQGRRPLSPGGPGADSVRREEGVHRSPAAGFAPSEGVRPVETGGSPAFIGEAFGLRDPLQEPGQREPDRVLDVRHHFGAERGCVFGDFFAECRDGSLGGDRQGALERRDDLSRELQAHGATGDR